MNRYHFDAEKHIHYFDNRSLSGTSSIAGVLPKTLTWWASGKALEPMGWTHSKTPKQTRIASAGNALGKIKGMGVEEYLELLDRAYRNHKDSLDKAADKGIDLHSILERYVGHVMGKTDLDAVLHERIQPFIIWSEKNVSQFVWSEAYCYSEKLWVGGICDAGAILNDGTTALIDFKSSKEAYTSAFLQCAGYALQIEENGYMDRWGNLLGKLSRPIEKLFVVPFGAEKVEPVENAIGIGDLKIGFEHAVGIYRLLGLEAKKEW